MDHHLAPAVRSLSTLGMVRRAGLLLLLGASLAASDAADNAFVFAQPMSQTELPLVAITVDADFVAVPVYLAAEGDTPQKVYENLQKAKQALIGEFKEPYRVSPMARPLPLADDKQGNSYQVHATLRYGVMIVKPLTQEDPEKVALEISNRLRPLSNDNCRLESDLYRLGLGDPERFRHDLLIRLEHYAEAARIALPRPGRARIAGLEAPLVVSEALEARQLLVMIPFTLRFEETQ